MFNRFVVVLLVLCSFLSAGIISKAQKGTKENPILIRVTDFPPLYFKDATGDDWIGVEADMVKAILDKMDLKYKFVTRPWGRALAQMKTGDIDIMLNLTKTPQRTEFIDFIGITRLEKISFVVKKDYEDMEIKTLDDLTKFKKKIGIQIKSYYPNITDRIDSDSEFKKHFHFTANTNSKQFMQMANAGNILGFFEDEAYIRYAIKTFPDYKNFVVHSFQVGEGTPVQIGASKMTDEAVREKMKKGYKLLESDGTLKKILDKWYN